MDKKPDYDLSNLGGRPKDWWEREQEKNLNSSEWDDFKFTWWPWLLAGTLLLCGIGLIYGIVQIGR